MTLAQCMACPHTRHRDTPKIAGIVFGGDRDIDACLRSELEALWAAGITTVCSCCGHGFGDEAYIVASDGDRQRMLELGYEERPPRWEHCAKCGVYFRAKTAGLPQLPIVRWYDEEGERDYMYDVKLETTNRSTACGPACLKMLLDYYGIEADMDALIAECNVSVNGCSGADMLRVGRAHGLEAMAAYQQTPADVLRQDRPGIVWWRYDHWIVFCGLNDAGDVVICNPCRGRFAIDADSFAALCAGLAEGTCVCLTNGEPEDLPA